MEDYIKYFRIGFGIKGIVIFFFIPSICAFAGVLPPYFISEQFDSDPIQNSFLLFIFAVVAHLSLIIVQNFLIVSITLMSNVILHKRMIKNLITSPMSFFDSNSIGRVLTRFTKDLSNMDHNMANWTCPVLMNFLFRTLAVFGFLVFNAF
jgi:ATP-binding cassette subfamily C (CFTR/MRP) protein 1